MLPTAINWSTPNSAARRPTSAWAGPLCSPSSAMSPSTATRRPWHVSSTRRLQGRQGRIRVRVVTVVQHPDPLLLPQLHPARRRHARPQAAFDLLLVPFRTRRPPPSRAPRSTPGVAPPGSPGNRRSNPDRPVSTWKNIPPSSNRVSVTRHSFACPSPTRTTRARVRAAITADAGSSPNTNNRPDADKHRASSLSSATTPSRSPKYSRCSRPIPVKTPQSGRIILSKCPSSPG